MRSTILQISIFLLFINQALGQICVGTSGQVTWSAWQDLYYPDLGELYAHADYPREPTISQTIYKLQSPINYDNYMGGYISGFISVPGDDDVTFNLTGDDKTRFYLSDGPNPDNISLEAYADEWSNVEEHDKYPSQTSQSISLQSGIFYYFEMHYVEGSGGDHISLYWKTIHEDPDNWTLINSIYINDVGCLPTPCPLRGTPCDDGDGSTTDDIEDGYCNCVGTPSTNNSCVGARYEITAYSYDTIPGGSLNDLYTSSNFPGMPNRSAELELLGISRANRIDSTGTLIEAFLSVPVSGNYKFNLTGNDQAAFFLSSDDDPANKFDTELTVAYSGSVEHDKSSSQTSGDVYLNADEYYFIEINHKEGAWTEHFSVFWQTPFTETDQWKRIPDMYIYDYTCEIACIPAGNLCDDGDPFTNNDVYDDNCNCVGTPCSGPDCNDPLASYVPYEKCNLTDQLDNRQDNNWLSCIGEANPNNLRADGHWIHYDLGQEYLLGSTHVWNYNVPGETDKGIQMAAIDYSIDGVNWTELDVFNWSLADGSSGYSGFIGPNFGDVQARYVLITSLDAGTGCKGLGKVVFNVSHCPLTGQACDDNNISTTNDVYDEFCVCQGTPLGLNACAIDTLILGDTLIVSSVYSAIDLVSSHNTVGSTSVVTYVAGQEVYLGPDFETALGAQFEAWIETCPSPIIETDTTLLRKIEDLKEDDLLRVKAVPDSDIQMIQFYATEAGHYQLHIRDVSGNLLYTIVNNEIINKGFYTKYIRTKKLNQGLYHVTLKGPSAKARERMTVI